MAAASQPTVAPAGVVFELERLELEDARLVVTGWWSGVRGMRFVRPTLVIGHRQVLATLEHKPWAPHGDGLWIAAFPWPHGKVDPGELSLAVTPRVTVPVLPGAQVEVVPDVELEAAEVEETGVRAAEAAEETARTAVQATRDEAPAPVPAPAPAPAGPDPEELRRAQAAAARERDGAVAQRDEAVHDREAALRTRRRMEAQRDEALQKLEATEAQLERALAERDEARASCDRAVRDREAAERARHSAEAEVEGVLRRVEAERAESRRDSESAEAERDRAIAQRDEAVAERDEARARRDDVLLAHRTLRRQVDALRAGDARGDAAPPADAGPELERQEPRGPDDPIGVREIPAARSVAAELNRGQRDRDRARDVSRFDLWAIRILGSIAATCFILLLVMVLRVFV